MKQSIISLLLFFTIFTVQAQEDSIKTQNDTVAETATQDKGNYFQFNLGGGFHNLNYEFENGDDKGLFGYTFDFGYSHFFKPKWGFGTGLGLHTFRSKSTMNLTTENAAVDNNGETFDYRTYYRNWQEKQRSYFVEIPISMLYQSRLANERWKILVGLGGKIYLPILAKYSTEGGEIETTGYYPQYNEERTDIASENFLTYTSFSSGGVDIRPGFGIVADFGAFYSLNAQWDLYMGLYANYCTSNVLSEHDAPVYQRNGVYNGLLRSNQVNDAHPISFGVKLGFRFHSKKKNQEQQDQSINEPIVEESSNNEEVAQDEAEQDTTQALTSNEENVPVNQDTVIQNKKDEPLNEEVTSNEENEPNKEEAISNEENQSVNQDTIIQNKEDEPIIENAASNEENEPVTDEVKPENEKNEVANEELIQENNKPEDEPVIIVEDKTKNDKPVAEEETVEEPTNLVEAKELASDTEIKFDFGSDETVTSNDEKLKSMAEYLKSNPDVNLRIVGHTCDIGSHEVNMIVGMERAEAIKKELIAYGAPESQLITESKAYDEPLVPNTSKENRAKNRRVQIIVVKKNK
jgi:outer membrane protein OmpA-like peptidoglycan-associated protein